MATIEEPEKTLPMEVAFGSGKTGITFVSSAGPGAIHELSLSYFPKEKRWITTPGQEISVGSGVGSLNRGDSAIRCVGCHSATHGAKSLIPEPHLFGVSCESCHGAGSHHIEAVGKKEKVNLFIDSLKGVGGESLNNTCGRCHRTAKDIRPDTADVTSTQRFQPFGLSLSKCFEKSNDSLTCTTCHNPHENSSTDKPAYEAICLQCHAPDAKPTVSISRVAVCPVNPKTDCVRCHMPPKPLFGDTGIPTEIADHYIRVYKELR